VCRIKEIINASKRISTPIVTAILENDSDPELARRVKVCHFSSLMFVDPDPGFLQNQDPDPRPGLLWPQIFKKIYSTRV
jgi:hypothetical protein